MLREGVRVHCAGRTDSGVHATGQVAWFRSSVESLPHRLTHSLNALLPRDVSVLRAIPVRADFHPRFSCIAREYEYLFHTGPRSPFWEGRAWQKRAEFNVAEIHSELQEILGERDFAALTRKEYEGKGTTRYLDCADLSIQEDPWTGERTLIVLRVRANAFLHNMIRILAGTIADRAAGRILSLPDAVFSRTRTKAGQTAPPDGLYFRRAYYLPGTAAALPELTLPGDHPLMRIHAGRIRSATESDQVDTVQDD